MSAQNIIIVHPSWFYPSSGMKNKSPKKQYFCPKKLIDSVLFDAFDKHRCASANIGTWPSLLQTCLPFVNLPSSCVERGMDDNGELQIS